MDGFNDALQLLKQELQHHAHEVERAQRAIDVLQNGKLPEQQQHKLVGIKRSPATLRRMSRAQTKRWENATPAKRREWRAIARENARKLAEKRWGSKAE